MDEFAPGTLQRLRAAEIIRAAGLAAASLGQEYSRAGAVREAQRQGSRLSGVVEPPRARGAHNLSTPESTHEPDELPRFTVDVEARDASSWIAHCTCMSRTSTICCHAAALLYEWLARPASFAISDVPSLSAEDREDSLSTTMPGEDAASASTDRDGRDSLHSSSPPDSRRGSEPTSNLVYILAQMGLNELRNLAREYDIAVANMTKNQLAEAIAGALSQPDTVRKAAATLEKLQRQLLATIILAGGMVTDADLHGLFERFAFAQSAKLQSVVLALQSKGFLLRITNVGAQFIAPTNLSSPTNLPSPRTGGAAQFIASSSPSIDIGWYVPVEARAALHVPLPITTFDIAQYETDQKERLEISHNETDAFLADLLLVARALAGCQTEDAGEQGEQRRVPYAAYSGDSPAGREATNIPPPSGCPTPDMLSALHAAIGQDRSPDYLRFAVRLLRLADILYKDEGGATSLSILPNAARLLLGPARAEIARDLFTLWRAQAAYDELFALQEEGLRLRCRTTLANQPVLRGGELETENSEARQMLLASIAQTPGDQWIQFPAFARFLYRLNPLFLQKQQRMLPTPHWWIEQEDGRPLQPTQMSDWMRAEGRYLERLLRGPLHWWGLIDLALASDGRLIAFRRSSTGGQLIGGEFMSGSEPALTLSDQARASTEAATPAPFQVDENGVVSIAASSTLWPVIERIEWFAEIAGVSNGLLRYRLAPQALASALARGHSPSVLLDLLRDIRAQFIAPTIAPRIERLAASYGRVRLYTGVSLLEVADAGVMRELVATTPVEQQIVQRITPSFMILNKGSAQRLAEEIRRRGQTPLLHEEADDSFCMQGGDGSSDGAE